MKEPESKHKPGGAKDCVWLQTCYKRKNSVKIEIFANKSLFTQLLL